MSKNLDAIAAREQRLFLTEQSRQFIQCAVNLMAHTSTPIDVAEFLRDLADQVENFE